MTALGYITTTLNWLGFFTTFFFAYYYFLRFRNRERMLLIEKGVDISEIYRKRRFSWNIFGFAFLGVSVGALFSVLLFIHALKIDLDGGVVILILASVLLCGSIGILVGNKIEKARK